MHLYLDEVDIGQGWASCAHSRAVSISGFEGRVASVLTAPSCPCRTKAAGTIYIPVDEWLASNTLYC